MNKFLVDTNILIALLSNSLKDDIPDGEYYYSTISRIELLSLANASEQDLTMIDEFLLTLNGVDLSAAIQTTAASLRRTHKIKLPDAVIVATAIAYDCTLLTNDMALHKLNACTTKSLSLNLSSERNI